MYSSYITAKRMSNEGRNSRPEMKIRNTEFWWGNLVESCHLVEKIWKDILKYIMRK
jgi:hypothetical protein